VDSINLSADQKERLATARTVTVIDIETDRPRTSALTIQVLTLDTNTGEVAGKILIDASKIAPNPSYDDVAECQYFDTQRQALELFSRAVIPEKVAKMLEERYRLTHTDNPPTAKLEELNYNLNASYLYEKVIFVGHNSHAFDFNLLNHIARREGFYHTQFDFKTSWVGKGMTRKSWAMPRLRDPSGNIYWTHTLDTLALARVLGVPASLKKLSTATGAPVQKKEFDIVAYLLEDGWKNASRTKEMLDYGIKDCHATLHVFLSLITDYYGELLDYIRNNFETHNRHKTCPYTDLDMLEQIQRGSGQMADLILKSIVDDRQFAIQQGPARILPSTYYGGHVGVYHKGRFTPRRKP